MLTGALGEANPSRGRRKPDAREPLAHRKGRLHMLAGIGLVQAHAIIIRELLGRTNFSPCSFQTLLLRFGFTGSTKLAGAKSDMAWARGHLRRRHGQR